MQLGLSPILETLPVPCQELALWMPECQLRNADDSLWA